MATLLLIVHVLVCLFLIFVVLVQGGKGAEMGAAFGGASQTLFGSRGSATFLGKLTTIVAVVFMITSLVLAVYALKGGGSIIKTSTLPQTQKSAAPGAPPANMPTGQPAQGAGQPSQGAQQVPINPAGAAKAPAMPQSPAPAGK